MEQKRKIKVDSSKNPAKNFGVILKDIENIAQNRKTSVVDVINDLISDLQNYYNKDYEIKVKEISVQQVTPNVINSFLSYMDKVKKVYKQKESIEKSKERRQAKAQEVETSWKGIQDEIDKSLLDGKQGTEIEIIERLISNIKQGEDGYVFDTKSKKYILKNLKDRIEEINKEEKDRESIQETMTQIEELVDREYEKGNIKNKVNYLMAIKKAIKKEKEYADFNIKIGETAKAELLQMIDDRINTEKDQLYYEEVAAFTKNFELPLNKYLEEINALYGNTTVKKFTNLENHNRYFDLIKKIKEQDAINEHQAIQLVIKNEDINDIDINSREHVIQENQRNKATR